MKKRILIALAALTILLCVPLITNAASVEDLTFDPATGTITKCDTEAEGELVIPEEINGVKVTGIGEYAFSDCGNLTSVNLPDGVTSINWWAFCDCKSLISVNIPENVTSIGGATFIDCGSLNIDVSPNNQNYCDIDGVLFTKDKKKIVAYAKDKLQPEYIIQNGVTNIGDFAFSNCDSMKSVNIPDSVTYIDEYAFASCDSLNIDVSQNNQNYCDIDGVLFTKNKKTIVAYAKDKLQPIYFIPYGVTNISYSAFQGCTSLTNINIPNSVTRICDHAFFECTNLTSINIPNSVTSIDGYVFSGCANLKNINIPDGVTSIGDLTFSHCWKLTKVKLPDSVTSIGYSAFSDCLDLTDVYYSGTEEQWKQIKINDNNNSLLSATIHYNSEMPIDPLEVQPVEPEKDVEANKITIPVTVTDIERAEELNDVRLYIAEYGAYGRLTNVTFGEKSAVEGDTVIFTADIPDAEHYKIMLWDANNAPLMDAVTSISE